MDQQHRGSLTGPHEIDRLEKAPIEIGLALDGHCDAFAEIQREARLSGGEGANDLREIDPGPHHRDQIPRLEHRVSVRDHQFVPSQDRSDYE